MTSEDIAAIKHELKEEGYNIYVYSYPNGMYFPPHSHEHDTTHVLFSGAIKVCMNGEEHVLEPGKRFVIPAYVQHSAEVLGDMPVVCLDATKPEGA